MKKKEKERKEESPRTYFCERHSFPVMTMLKTDDEAADKVKAIALVVSIFFILSAFASLISKTLYKHQIVDQFLMAAPTHSYPSLLKLLF
ncbi:CLUMA_CG007595, isoform A [Clunio marinus]|uniref:CLUMA_CG007595, isoform A n=1 Tax=Clunio marinus TaxID=568069 RepID=A0A1J1I163_9DIPT|nr:CLUMA_CG007595, isoform A [Clunio marinus]